MKPSLPAADLMNSDFSIFSADSGAHQEFAADRDPTLAATRSPVLSCKPLHEPFREFIRIRPTAEYEKTRQRKQSLRRIRREDQ